MAISAHITVRGAREGPLNGIDCQVRLGAFTCLRGPAGGGARALAVDVLGAESRRRYMLALAPVERAELGGLAPVAVDDITGLPPAVHVDPRRELVGGATLGRELRLDEPLARLLHEAGSIHCPRCGGSCRALSAEAAADLLVADGEDGTWLVLAPLAVTARPDWGLLAAEMGRAGFVRLRVDGTDCRLDQDGAVGRLSGADRVEVVVDRVRADGSQRLRILDAVRSARAIGTGRCLAEPAQGGRQVWLNQQLTCAGCASTWPPLLAEHLLGSAPGSPHPLRSAVTIGELDVTALRSEPLAALRCRLQPWSGDHGAGAAACGLLEAAVQAGLSAACLDWPVVRLSAGERVRLALARCLGAGLVGVLYVLEGLGGLLHPRDVPDLIAAIRELVARGNTVLTLAHSEPLAAAADQVLDFGAARAVTRAATVPRPGTGRGELELSAPASGPLGAFAIGFPLGCLVVVTGPSAAGKSYLLRTLLLPALAAEATAGQRLLLRGHPGLARQHVIEAGHQLPGGAGRLLLALGLGEHLSRVFAASPAAQRRGYPAEWFRLDAPGGRCPQCEGRGVLRYDMDFLEDIALVCPGCQGRCFREQIDEVTVRGLSIGDVLGLDVDAFAERLGRDETLRARLDAAQVCGLGQVLLGTRVEALEAAPRLRLQLAQLLPRLGPRDLVVLDMPAAGEHDQDVESLVGAARACVARGATVVVADHQPLMVGAADCLVTVADGRVTRSN